MTPCNRLSRSEVKKQKEFQVINELGSRNLISKKLMIDLARNVAIKHSNSAVEALEKYDLIDYVPPAYQLLIINKVFGDSIQKNSFFKSTGIDFIVELLKDIYTRKVAPGEYIYNSNMPSHSSRPW